MIARFHITFSIHGQLRTDVFRTLVDAPSKSDATRIAVNFANSLYKGFDFPVSFVVRQSRVSVVTSKDF